MSHRSIPVRVLVILMVLGCQTKGEDSAKQAPSATASSAPSQTDTASAQAALDSLDERSPVPLLPMMANHQKQNMRDHLMAVQAIVAALGAKDFAAIEKAAARIGYSEQMGRMCTHMGAGAPGFTELALQFHRTADEIGGAARRSDPDAVVKALTDTLATCTGCHARFKQQVVDDATWTAATKLSAPTGPGHQLEMR